MIFRIVLTALGAAAIAVAAPAQTPPDPNSAASAADAACCTIPGETPALIEITEPLTSMHSRTGQMFAIRLAEPIVVDGRTLVPAGVTGMGEVVHARRGGAISSSPGELILAARSLDFAGIQIPLHRTGFSRSGRDGAWMFVPYAGLTMGRGGGVRVEPGTRVKVVVRGDVRLPAQ